MWYVHDILYAVLYVCGSCFVVRGCGVLRRYIGVCYCDMQRQPSSGSAWPACPKNGKSGHHWGREGSTQFAQQLLSAVTDPPLVGCVVWSLDTL